MLKVAKSSHWLQQTGKASHTLTFLFTWSEQSILYTDYVLQRNPGIKALVNEDTLLPMMFLGLHKLGNICCGHKMFLNKIRNSFCVPDTKFVSATSFALMGKRGNICVGNNVSSFTRSLKEIAFLPLHSQQVSLWRVKSSGIRVKSIKFLGSERVKTNFLC